jgi:hypothetical protein
LNAIPARADEVPRDRIEQLYREGRAARERGELTLAYQLLSDAWGRRKTHDVAASLAQVEYELGRVRDAAEHLAYACEHLPASADPVRVGRLLTALEQIKQKLVTLTLVVEPNTAEVAIDDRSLGVALALPREVFADPGTIELSAKLEGYARWGTSVRGRAGEHKEIRVRLERIEEGAKAPKVEVTMGPRGSTRTGTARDEHTGALGPFIVSATITGVALASGVTFWLVADSREAHAEDRLDDLPGNNRCGVGTPYEATCRDVRSGLESAQTFRAVAFGAFGVSLAGAAVSYLLWPKHQQAAVGVTASFSTSTGWIGAEAQF